MTAQKVPEATKKNSLVVPAVVIAIFLVIALVATNCFNYCS